MDCYKSTKHSSKLQKCKHYKPTRLRSFLDTEFIQLEPSKEVLQYCRSKFYEFCDDLDDVKDKIELMRTSLDTNLNLQEALQEREKEIAELKNSMSDLSIFMSQEREVSLQAQAENDRLQVQLAECHKKIQFLLDVCGMPENQLTHFLIDTKHIPPVPHRYSRGHGKSHKNKTDKLPSDSNAQEASTNYGLLSDEVQDYELLKATVYSLRSQLHEVTKQFNDEKETILEDRKLLLNEAEKERDRLNKQIDDLKNRLKIMQNNLTSTVNDLVIAKEMCYANEFDVLHEKKAKKEFCEGCSNTSTNKISGSGNTTKKPSDVDDQLLKENLELRDKVIQVYQQENSTLEDKIIKLKCQLNQQKNVFKEKQECFDNKIFQLKKKYLALDARRRLQAEGFQKDIVQIKSRLRVIEQALFKITLAVDLGHFCHCGELKVSTDLSKAKIKKLDEDLRQIRIKLSSLEDVEVRKLQASFIKKCHVKR